MHTDACIDPYIPQHLSHIAIHYSIPCFLVSSSVAWYRGHRVLACLEFILYFTSVQHWDCMYRHSLAKTCDVTFVLTTMTYSSLVLPKHLRDPSKSIYWYMTLGTSLVAHCLNESVLHDVLSAGDEFDDAQIEWAMLRSILVHMVFFHYAFSICSIYCTW